MHVSVLCRYVGAFLKSIHTTCVKALSWDLSFVTDGNSCMHHYSDCEETERDRRTSACPVRDASK